jgi:type I restriction enzyme S subunit
MNANAVLPDGWTEATFGKVVANVSINEKKLPKGQYSESGRFPVVDQGQQFIGGYSDDEEKVVSEDLPLLVFGDHTRIFKFLDQPFVPGADGVKVLKPLGVNPKWLYQIAHALDFPDKGYARHFQHLKAAQLFVPPLPEQRRIVAEIEKQFTRLEAGVAALRRVQANLKRYRAAVLKAACEGRLVPTEAELARKERRTFETGETLLARILTERRKSWTGRGHYREAVTPDRICFPELPVGWTLATVEQLAAHEPNSITDGPFGSNLKTEHYTDNGPRVIRLKNIGDGVYVDKEAHISQRHFEQLQKHRIFANDVVIAAFGEDPPRSCIIPEALGPAIVKADCVRFKPHSSITPQYMNATLNSDPVRKRTKGMVHGVGRPRLNLGEIKSIALPLPPLAEQARIVTEVERRLSVVEESEAVVSANLQRAARLRQGVLAKSFSVQTAYSSS